MIHEILPVGMLQCNCSIFGDENTREAIVVDPGDEIESIEAILNRHQLRVKAIVITHAHIDHIGGAQKLKAATGAPVWMNANDQELYNHLDVQAGWLGMRTPERTEIDHGAKDGDTLLLADTPMHVLHTPGHTQGSLCLWIPSENKLVAGDTLFRESIGRTDLPGGNHRQILVSIHTQLMQLPEDAAVVPGHGPNTTIGHEKNSIPSFDMGIARHELPDAEWVRAYRTMLLSRRLDDREVLLKRQSKIYFQISGAGHEAVQTALGMQLRAGVDWVYPYYRDRALCLALGVTAKDMLLQAVGAAEDEASGGRQMPSHWGSQRLSIVSSSSPTGTQFLQAVGCAEAGVRLHPNWDEITAVCSGDGTTSEGEFWESLNLSCLGRLPLLYLIEDNGFAISVPVETQTAGGSISKLLTGFPSLFVREVDGTDFAASYAALHEAIAHCRARRGPALVHAHVIRPYSHSLSDDERLYKTAAERDEETRRDPVFRFPEFLIGEGIAERHALQLVGHEVEMEVHEATEYALQAAGPVSGSTLDHLHSDRFDPCAASLDVTPLSQGEPRTMVDSINQTLAEEMRNNQRILVFGEDVADCGRTSHLSEVKGKGGVFKATQNLQREFGYERCFNAPLAEAGIVGRAIGLATRGFKPIPEIQFFDYIWPAMMQIRDEVATLRWRSNNGFSCPMVIRVAIGGYLGGGAVYHSQSGEVAFTHIPGLRVVMPSNAQDACGLLRTAIRCDDPVLFLEHKKLYREPYNRAAHPGVDFTVPFGKARTVKPGHSLTLITYGALVQKSMLAALQLEKRRHSWSIEVIDLRSLAPYDWGAIAESVQRTNRVVIAHEDTRSWGFGAEIAARIADELFGHLDAPVGRVAALDTWVAYNPSLEDEILPQVDHVAAEMERILLY